MKVCVQAQGERMNKQGNNSRNNVHVQIKISQKSGIILKFVVIQMVTIFTHLCFFTALTLSLLISSTFVL